MPETAKPGPGDQPLVGASEAAEIMEVELSTFSHLRRREEATENSKFPKPLAVLRCGPVWKTSEIKRFASKYEAPRPGPKPAPAAKPIRKVTAKTPTKAVAKATPGNGGNGDAVEKPAKSTKRAAKKVGADKVVAKRSVRQRQLAQSTESVPV